MSDARGVGGVRIELDHTSAELLAKLCVELETEDATGVLSRALGLLEMQQRTKRQGGRLGFCDAHGDVTDELVATRGETDADAVCARYVAGIRGAADETFLRSIEERIDIPASRTHDFRREVIAYIDALASEGRPFGYATNDRLRKAFEASLQPTTLELNHTLAELLARLCVELETEQAAGVLARGLGLLETVQHTKRQGGRLCFVNEHGNVADVVF